MYVHELMQISNWRGDKTAFYLSCLLGPSGTRTPIWGALKQKQIKILKDYCLKHKIKFLASCFNLESLELYSSFSNNWHYNMKLALFHELFLLFINPPERSEGGLVVRDLQIWCHTLGNLYLCQRAARFIRKSTKF